jgi:hypothetical protein
MTILILSTSINTLEQKKSIQPALDELAGRNNWTIDLGDVDKVLRVIAETDILFDVIDVLQQYRFNSCLMDVFDMDAGPCVPDYPNPCRAAM